MVRPVCIQHSGNTVINTENQSRALEKATSHENKESLNNMLNIIFVLHCRRHSRRPAEIVHIAECGHSWQKATNVS